MYARDGQTPSTPSGTNSNNNNKEPPTPVLFAVCQSVDGRVDVFRDVCTYKTIVHTSCANVDKYNAFLPVPVPGKTDIS